MISALLVLLSKLGNKVRCKVTGWMWMTDGGQTMAEAALGAG